MDHISQIPTDTSKLIHKYIIFLRTSTFLLKNKYFCYLNMLNSLITSKTRLRMLIKFFVNAANNGYLNGLAHEFNESTIPLERN